MKKPKVVGIGFHKTGTTSLKVALEMLGYRVTGPNGTENPRISSEVRDMAVRLLQEYDAAQDNPWPLLFEDVDRWYPGSKFVFTTRPTDQWIKSVVNFFGDKSTPMREWIYGIGCPRGNEDVYIKRYERHTRDVTRYFEDRPDDLLVLDLAKGDGWEKLCPFLGFPVRLEPFPHVNAAGRPYRQPSLRAKVRRTVKRLFRFRSEGLV